MRLFLVLKRREKTHATFDITLCQPTCFVDYGMRSFNLSNQNCIAFWGRS
jgi:hypothetical protein